MATTETLSFDRHLRHAFAPLSARLENGIRSLDGVIEVLRLRIEAEAQFTASLQRITSNEKLLSYLSPTESLRKDGLDAIHADMRNEYTQRLEFLNSLNEDVYQPCVSIRELYAEKNRLFASDTKTHIKSLRQHQNQFYKIKTKYEKVCREASNARTALLNAKLDNKISSAQILKLGTKVNSTLKTQQTWKEKYDQQQLIWNRQQIKFDDEMTMILQGMQSNEYNRMKTTKDSMNKWAVFVTNLCANRNYDVKNLAQSMSMINIDSDLQIFIAKTLEKHPSKNPNGIGPPPPHHSLHYGKLHQNALNNLNKTSTDKSNLKKVNTNPKPIKFTHSSSQLSTSHHQRNRSNNSLSLSSFGPSFTGNHSRKHSQSYSLSGQQDIMNELSKRQYRQNSSRTPNSIGSFFKQKFQKQRSYNSQRMPDTHMNHHQSREPSNTISSYARDGSVVLPDGVVDYDDHTSPTKVFQSPQSPKSLPITNINVINGSVDNAIDIIHIADPEIPNSPKSVNLTLNHHQNASATNNNTNPNPNSTSSQINRTMKKKKLNKPKMRRKKKQSIKQSIKLTNSNTQHTPQQSPNHTSIKTKTNPSPIQKPISPTPITPMIMDSLDNHQNISSYKNVNNHSSQQIIKQLTHSPKPQIIVIKKKSKSPRSRHNSNSNSNNHSNNSLHNNNNNNNTYTINTKIDNSSSDEALPSGGSTPTLSGGSDNDKKDDIIPPTNEPTTPTTNEQPSKPDTPLPKHKKKKILYAHKSNESANLEFAANHIINRKIRHSYAESEDDFDPLD